MDSSLTLRLWISVVASLFLVLLIIQSSSAQLAVYPPPEGPNAPNAYEVLRQHNLPAGLLPKGVKGYDINVTTGEFAAYFNESCSFSVQNSYEMKFKTTITGFIAKDKILSLNGVSVKFFLLSLNIVGILRNGDNLLFSAGAESAPFPIDNFEESAQCGCGFHCTV